MVKVLELVIVIVGLAFSSVIFPYLKNKLSKQQMENIAFWAKIATRAAEQIYKEKGQGKLKKEYVMSFLKEKGLEINEDDFETLVEAAVLELNEAKDNWGRGIA